MGLANLPEEIKAIMSDKGITAYKLCKDIGIDQSALSRYFATGGGISNKVIETILSYMGYELTLRKKKKTP